MTDNANKPQPGDRIRFTRTLIEPADGDHPDLLYAKEGEFGSIVSFGTCSEGFMVQTDSLPTSFGASIAEFEVIEKVEVRVKESVIKAIAIVDQLISQIHKK